MCINYRKYNGVLRPCIVWTLYLWVGKASLRMWNLSPNLRDYSRCEPGHRGGIGRVSVCVWGGGDAVFLGQVSVGDRSDFRERKPASIPDTRN